MRARTLGVVTAFVLVAGCGEIPPSPTSPTLASPSAQAPSVINLVPNPAALPEGGGTSTIHVEVQAGIAGVRGVTVTLEASAGTLSATQAVTNDTGHATVRWDGSQTGVITARVGELASSATVSVAVPVVFPPLPPPVPPPTPNPPPPIPPGPPGPPALTVTLSSSAPTVTIGGTLTFTADVAHVQPGEQIVMFQWDLDGDANRVAEFTTTANTRTSHAYTQHGPLTARVTVTTTQRVASASTQIIVTN